MTTVSAAIVSAGVGLPPVWRIAGDSSPGGWVLPPDDWQSYGSPVVVDVANPPTRSGLLRQLAKHVGDDGSGQAYWLSIEEPAFVLRRNGVKFPLAKFYGVPGTMPWNGYHTPAVEEVLDGSTLEALAAILADLGRQAVASKRPIRETVRAFGGFPVWKQRRIIRDVAGDEAAAIFEAEKSWVSVFRAFTEEQRDAFALRVVEMT